MINILFTSNFKTLQNILLATIKVRVNRRYTNLHLTINYMVSGPRNWP